MMKRILALLGILAALGLTVAGCSNQLNDLGGIRQAKPDYVLTYLNVNDFPNVTMLCIHGAGFATITRDYNALTRVPEWDAFCLTKAGRLCVVVISARGLKPVIARGVTRRSPVLPLSICING